MDDIDLNSIQFSNAIYNRTNIYAILTRTTYTYLNICPTTTIIYLYVLNTSYRSITEQIQSY